MKMLAIVGSLRKESYNLQLALTVQERFRDRFEMEFADIKSLPHFNQDDEFNPPESVLTLRKQILDADGIIIFTPEYNWSIPGVLKNALDWMSRVEKVLIGKPLMAAGAAGGPMGTIRAQLQLRQILQSLQVNFMPPAGNEILINMAAQKFDSEKLRLIDEPTLQFVDGVIFKFVDFVRNASQ